MTIVTWKNSTSGKWTVGADWSTGAVPNGSDDVVIAGTGAYTVTVASGSNTADALGTTSNVTLALTGGTLDLLTGGTIDGVLTQSGSAHLLLAGKTLVNGKLTQKAGTVTVAKSGTLTLHGATSSIGGTIGGAGSLDLAAGTTTLAGTAVLTVAHLTMNGGTLSLAGGITYSGSFDEAAGALLLNDFVLTLGGPATLSGSIVGSTLLELNAAAALVGASIGGSLAVEITGGTTTLRGASSTLGSTAASDPNLLVDAGATLSLTGTTGLKSAETDSKLLVLGTLAKTAAGESLITPGVYTTTNSDIDVAAGTLALKGGTNTLAGSIDGAGTLLIAGAATLDSNGTISVAAISVTGSLDLLGNVTFGSNLYKTGIIFASSGTVNLGANDTLNLNGSASFTGGELTGSGTLFNESFGSTDVGSGFLDDGALLVSNGVDQTGTVTFDNAGVTSYNYWLAGGALLVGIGPYLIDDPGLLEAGGPGICTVDAQVLVDDEAGDSEPMVSGGSLEIGSSGQLDVQQNDEANVNLDELIVNGAATLNDYYGFTIGQLLVGGSLELDGATDYLETNSTFDLTGTVTVANGVVAFALSRRSRNQ